MSEDIQLILYLLAFKTYLFIYLIATQIENTSQETSYYRFALTWHSTQVYPVSCSGESSKALKRLADD